MSRPEVETRIPTREQLATMAADPRMRRQLEALFRDVAQALPDAAEQSGNRLDAAEATAQAAQAAADAATTTSSSASTAATAALTAAQAAQTSAATLGGYAVALLPGTASVANARPLVAGANVVLTNTGAALTVASLDAVAVATSDATESAVSWTNVPGLSMALIAFATYVVEASIVFSSAATGTGIDLSMTLPAGATIHGQYSHPGGASYNTAASTSGGATAGVSASGANLPLHGRWIVSTGATAGSAVLRFRTGVNGSAVTVRGSISRLHGRRLT